MTRRSTPATGSLPVTDTGVTVEDMATGETKTIAADTVVLAMGTHSQEAWRRLTGPPD